MTPLSAGELLAGYAARTLSPVEVVAELSAAIGRDPHGAFWALCLERAAEEARAAEDAWARGGARPLEGVPIAVKDIFDTEGVATTYGSAMFAGHVPERDAEAVRRVRAAGAIVLGKTATHEFAWGFSSINDALGTVRNPLDPERVAGGSSGGSAAALAAGLAPLALGTDTGGSIRVPSAFCRTYGLKPTWGRVSLDGVWPLARTLDHAGPMARTPEDLALLLGVLAPVPAHVAGTPPRVAVCPDLHGAPLEPQVAAAHDELAAALGAAELPFPEAELIVPAFRTIQLAEGHETHRSAGLYPDRAGEYGSDVLPARRAGRRGHAAAAARRPRRPRDGPGRVRAAVRARRRAAHARGAARPAADRGRARGPGAARRRARLHGPAGPRRAPCLRAAERDAAHRTAGL